ncbi:MAG: cysteine desulfurase [Parachlamydiales bacterium]|nr:cysteine desulfurase [Parachlamydiales bacterium]
MKKIYLDNNATTTIDPEVLKVISQEKDPSNPSSIHFYGRNAKKLLLNAKENIATFLQTKVDDLIFTSGGTEAVNTAIKGLALSNPKCNIISTNTDHSCVFNSVKYLGTLGFDITYLDTGKYGALKPEQIKEALKDNTKIIVISAVNSETGVLSDYESIAKIAQDTDIYLIVDGVALLGKKLFKIPKGISAMCFSAHKMHGPKGVGLLYLRSDIKSFTPLLHGGPQENEKRAGTENLYGILGFSKAIDLLKDHLPKAEEKMQKLKDHFENTLKTNLDISVNGEGLRICNTSNICFNGIEAETLLILLDQNGVLASHGSACASGSITASRVLINMGYSLNQAKSSIRFSICRNTTKEEIDTALNIIIKIVKELEKI